MSGLEIAGVLLGTFPLIISGLEHFRDTAKVAGFWWQVRQKYSKCQHDVQYHEIVYKRNLKEILLPIISDPVEATRLLATPGGDGWSNKDLQDGLEQRLLESYTIYMSIITEMNETVEQLRKELAFDKDSVQSKLACGDQTKSSTRQPRMAKGPLSKSNLDYQMFRVKFSLGEPKRIELFNQLQTCNDRLEKLLNSSDKVSVLQTAKDTTTKRAFALEAVYERVWRKSDLLFRALQKAWRCSCQKYHFANLRLEHRILPETCFDIILIFIDPFPKGALPWSWKELQCRQIAQSQAAGGKMTVDPPLHPPKLAKTISSVGPEFGRDSKQKIQESNTQTSTIVLPPKLKKVAFTISTPVPMINIGVDLASNFTIDLCERLSTPVESTCDCMAVVSHNNESYHLFPERKRKAPDGEPVSLNYVLSDDFEGFLSRRQRYLIALLIASSVAQLQFTPWLRNGLTKHDVLFFPHLDSETDICYGEPFIRQSFDDNYTSSNTSDTRDCNFYSLGILLLELCFGKRLEDHPLRKRYPTGDEESRAAFDIMAALKWTQSVGDEGGDDYASAVKWCFTGVSPSTAIWRTEIINDVIRPLEMCQEHFRTTSL